MKGIIQKGKELRKDLFKKEDGSVGGPAKKVFGGTIDRNSEEIPVIMTKCVEYLDATGLEFEGIFRKSGSLAQVNEFKARFDKGEDVDLSGILDPHIVAGLLKMYVRELADPLLTFELYDVFLATIAIKDPSIKIPKLRQVLSFLPRANLMVVRYLVAFLAKVSAKSSVNMMTPSNLAIVFAPNLLRPPLSGEQEIAAMMEDTPFSNELLQTLISNFDTLFEGVESEKLSQPKLISESQNRDRKPSVSTKKPLPPIPQETPENREDGYEYQVHSTPDYQKPLPSKPATPPNVLHARKTSNDNITPVNHARKTSSDNVKPLPQPVIRAQNVSSAPTTPISSPSISNNPFIINNNNNNNTPSPVPRATPKPPVNPFIDQFDNTPTLQPSPHVPPKPHAAPLPSPPVKKPLSVSADQAPPLLKLP
jgi:hypothetical protein